MSFVEFFGKIFYNRGMRRVIPGSEKTGSELRRESTVTNEVWNAFDVGLFPTERAAVEHAKRFGRHWPIISIAETKKNYRLWIPVRKSWKFLFASPKFVIEVFRNSHYLVRRDGDDRFALLEVERREVSS